jgi:hypothetical protein
VLNDPHLTLDEYIESNVTD